MGLDDLEAFHTDVIIVDYYLKACEKIEELELLIAEKDKKIKELEEKFNRKPALLTLST